MTKKPNGRTAFALAAIISTVVAHPAAALAQGICTASYTTNRTSIQCRTSLSENAIGEITVNSSTQTTMRVVFFEGQDKAQGFLMDRSGNVVCVGDDVRGRPATARTNLCPPGGILRVTVN